MEAKRNVRVPQAPHPDTLRNPNFTILDSSGTRLLCWCPLHRCGAVYSIEAEIWNLQVPLGFGEFLTALRERGLVVDDSPDLVQWIETCAAAEGPKPNAPGGRC